MWIQQWPLQDLTDSEYTFSAEDYGDYIVTQLGCEGADGLQCLRDMDASALMTPLVEHLR